MNPHEGNKELKSLRRLTEPFATAGSRDIRGRSAQDRDVLLEQLVGSYRARGRAPAATTVAVGRESDAVLHKQARPGVRASPNPGAHLRAGTGMLVFSGPLCAPCTSGHAGRSGQRCPVEALQAAEGETGHGIP